MSILSKFPIFSIFIINFYLSYVSLCNVSPFDPPTIQQIFKYKRPSLFLLTSSNQASSQNNKKEQEKIQQKQNRNMIMQFHNTAEKYYQIYPYNSTIQHDLLFVISDTNDGLFTYQRLAQFLGVHIQDTPAIIYLTNHSNNDKYKFNNTKQIINAENLLRFIQQSKNKEITPYYKSQSIGESIKNEQARVKTIVGKNFKQLVLNSQKQFFIIFYAPWQYKSRVIKQYFQIAAQLTKKNKNIVFAQINGLKNEIQQSYLSTDANQKQNTEIRINQNNLPMIKFWRKDKTKKPIQYSTIHQTQNSEDFMIVWLKKHTQYEWNQNKKTLNEQL